MSAGILTATLARLPQRCNGTITSLLGRAEALAVCGEWIMYGTKVPGADYLPSLCESVINPRPLRTLATPRAAVSKRVRLAAPASDSVAAAQPSDDARDFWRNAVAAVRGETERRAALLSPEDQVIQSMPDTSPTKWHRAHATWFFEQFMLRPYVPDAKPFDERFAYLFNSYYVAVGPRQAPPQRELITRPNAAEVAEYRAHVDAAVGALIQSADTLATLIPIIEIGLHHEQQHQELLLTDILHAFSFNETHPAYDPDWQWPQPAGVGPAAGAPSARIHMIGHGDTGFCFDNEQPAHQVVLRSVRLGAAAVVTPD